MAFIPVIERKALGKKVLAPNSHLDLLHHNEGVSNLPPHTGKRINGIPRVHHLDDDLSLHRGRAKAYDNGEISQREKLERPAWRSKTSLEKVEYKPIGLETEEAALKFAAARNQFFDEGAGLKFKSGLRLAPLPGKPPVECEVPGFQGMGNPIYIVPNERPNMAAATKTNAVIGKNVPFLGERKNNGWSVWEEGRKYTY